MIVRIIKDLSGRTPSDKSRSHVFLAKQLFVTCFIKRETLESFRAISADPISNSQEGSPCQKNSRTC
jgi:hypothetical protein